MLKKLLKKLQAEEKNLSKHFIIFFISVIVIFVSVILILLNLFGVINIGNIHVMDVMDTQLSSYTDNIEHDYNKLAAYAISFSDQLEKNITEYLAENNISFEDLRDNTEDITKLQNVLYDTVYLNMQMSPSSGAFYILNTTINSNTEIPYYNGVYLKYINIFSESTVNNSFTLYRGSYATGKSRSINFHSGWQNEMQTDFFETCNQKFTNGVHYILSKTVEIPDTWERARFIYVPIRDLKENIIGVCGFEINDLYFQLAQNTINDKLGPLVCALLDQEDGVYSGQFNSNRYNSSSSPLLSVTSKKNFQIFDFGDEKCIGKSKEIFLGNDYFSVALMLTEPQYQYFMEKGRVAAVLIFLLMAILATLCCIFMNKTYVYPIFNKLEQLKYQEEKLKEAEDAYAKALVKYNLAQSEVRHLAGECKEEIVPEDYEFFVEHLNTLTPTEYRIYHLYLEGHNQNEIADILDIKLNTIKYHNKNIYSKLGISSRKQLVRYGILKQYQEQTK